MSWCPAPVETTICNIAPPSLHWDEHLQSAKTCKALLDAIALLSFWAKKLLPLMFCCIVSGRKTILFEKIDLQTPMEVRLREI